MNRSVRRVLTALLVAGALLVSGGCLGRHSASGAPEGGIPVGQSSHSVQSGGLARTFRLYRPAGLSGTVPLVVMLHGGYGDGAQAESAYNWDGQADAGRFLVAYPDGMDRAWNAGTCCGIPKNRNIDDVGFITAMVGAIEAQMPIDPARIYVTGMSNGAMMALRLGCQTDLFAAVAPELPWSQRLPLSNLWLFRPLVERLLAKGPATNAMLRTTTALTMLNAGNKDNVLPGEASAVVNFRLLPGDSVASVTAHVRQAIADERIEVKPVGVAVEPSAVSSATAPAFKLIERTVREVFPDALVAPGLVLAGTDAKHYEAIADNAYRFMPIRFRPEDLPRVHGTDERIAVDQLADMVRFYHRLIAQAAQ